MKILWFEVTEPAAYVSEKAPINGWQDSLERIVRTVSEIDLTIVFISENHSDTKVIEGVKYIPIHVQWSSFERKFRKYWDVYVEKMLPCAIKIVEDCKPDLIHIFGTEWPFGMIAAYTSVPVVIHIMGAIVPYNNVRFPANYSLIGMLMQNWYMPITLFHLWQEKRNSANREMWECRIWKLVSNYMGRTQWDRSLSNVLHPGRNYFHVDEALRMDFLMGGNCWQLPQESKLRLISIGCSSFWKGPDMMLKVAKILTELRVDFEWQIVGWMNSVIKKAVERQERARFEDCNVHFIGFKKSVELKRILCASTIYVHTAYIENSPNSICEAQCLGLPVVSTNVGGISSLVRHDIDGILVAAGDPWQMADAIINLYNDETRMIKYSNNSRAFALSRHSDGNIKEQLLNCYNQVIRDNVPVKIDMES